MFKNKKSKIKLVMPNDQSFIINDGIVIAPRASFKITTSCPEDYKEIILRCIEYGWLQPVAHMLDSELMWEELKR